MKITFVFIIKFIRNLYSFQKAFVQNIFQNTRVYYVPIYYVTRSVPRNSRAGLFVQAEKCFGYKENRNHEILFWHHA